MARGAVVNTLMGGITASIESKVAEWFDRHRSTILVFVGVWVSGLGLAFNGVLPGLTYQAVFWFSVAAVISWWVFRWGRWTWRRRAQYAEVNLPPPSVWALAVQGWRFRRKLRKIRAQWDVYCATHKLAGIRGVTPKFRSVGTTLDGDITCTIFPGRIGLVGGVDKIVQNRHAIAEVCTVQDVVPERKAQGVVGLTFRTTSPLARVHRAAEMRPPEGKNQVGYGVREDGDVATFDALNHVLVAGQTGSGKSGVLWSALANLDLQGVPHDLYASDIKRIELKGFATQVQGPLGDGEVRGPKPLRVIDYGNDVASTIRLIDKVERFVKARQEVFPDRQWTFAHAEKWPMTILAFDEMVQFMRTIKSDQRTAANKNALLRLATIAAEGRALGVFIWGLTQLAQKEILDDIRDLIPQQLCLQQKNRINVDMVLGDGAAKSGAPAHKIRNQPGFGYSAADHLADFVPFRSWWCDQADVDRIAEGVLPRGVGAPSKATAADRDCAVYVFFSHRGVCLYVGEGYDPVNERWPDHAGKLGKPAKKWWTYVDHSRTRPLEWCGSKVKAKAREKQLIEQLHPIGNTQENIRNPWRGRYDLLDDPRGADKQLARLRRVPPPPPPVPVNCAQEFFDQDTAPTLYPNDAVIVPLRTG